jgi:hypothetical protein
MKVMKRIYFVSIFALIVPMMLKAQSDVPKKMELGTNFWNIAWHPDTDVFIPGIVWENAYSYENIWNPQFLEELKIYNSLRFMDWGETNSSSMFNWDDRTLPTEEQGRPGGERRGVAYEWWIDLCNRTQTDMWVCMPHGADDNFIRQLAIMVRDSLNPSLKCYLELSNEVWNFRVQKDYCATKGVETGLATVANDVSAMYYQAHRSTEMWKIWMDEWAGEKERIIKVLAGHSANSWRMRQHFDFLNSDKNYLNLFPDAYAIAPYFGNNTTGNDPNIFQILENYILTEAVNGKVPIVQNVLSHYAFLQDYEIDLICYEGGQHITNMALSANRDPRMYDMYEIYLDTIQHYISHFSHYLHVGSFSDGGCWGAMEYTGQDISAAHKYRALVDYANRNSPPVMENPQEVNLISSQGTMEIVLQGINDNNYMSDQNITITAVSSDAEVLSDPVVVYDGGEIATLKLTASEGVVDTVILYVVLEDDGGTENGGADKSEYTIQVNVYEEWNSKPEIENFDVVETLEDQPVTFQVSGINDGDDGSQHLSLDIENINSVAELPVNVAYEGGSTASITLNPDENASGYGELKLVISDDGGNDKNNGDQVLEHIFGMNVIPVNDQPKILEISDEININSAYGPQDVYLRGISDNDPDADQNVTVTASTENTDLLDNLQVFEHSSASNRRLEVTPVSNSEGVATITLLVRDDGGTENGGIDEVTMSFNVNVGVFTSVENHPDGGLDIYPNVTDGVLNVEFITSEEYNIRITDLSGKIHEGWSVYSKSPSSLILNVSGISSGIYLLSVIGRDTIYTGQFMIR